MKLPEAIDLSSSFESIARIAVLALILTPIHAAHGYTWDNDYGVDAGTGSDDNFRLSETDPIETTWNRAGFFASLDGTTEISSLRLVLDANQTDYSEAEIEDVTAYGLSMLASRRGERLSGNLDLSLDNRSTTETELLDTGAVIDGERKTASVAPGLEYRFSERNSLFANLTARDVTYDTVSLTEYTENAVSLGWRHSFDEANAFSASLSAWQYDPEDDEATEVGSLSIGYDYRASETTRFGMTIGYSDVQRPDDSESSSDLSLEFERDIDERNRLRLLFRNSYEPSGAGEVREEDRLELQWNHGLSERASLTASATALGTDERDYYEVSLGAGYNLVRTVRVGATLRHREQEIGAAQADSSSVFVSLSYSPL